MSMDVVHVPVPAVPGAVLWERGAAAARVRARGGPGRRAAVPLLPGALRRAARSRRAPARRAPRRHQVARPLHLRLPHMRGTPQLLTISLLFKTRKYFDYKYSSVALIPTPSLGVYFIFMYVYRTKKMQLNQLAVTSIKLITLGTTVLSTKYF